MSVSCFLCRAAIGAREAMQLQPRRSERPAFGKIPEGLEKAISVSSGNNPQARPFLNRYPHGIQESDMFFNQAPMIEFLCSPEDKDVIAEPTPAKAHLPDWFRKIPAVDTEKLSASDNGLTIKRCMPFLDAMTTGWIIPVAATVRLEVRNGGATVDAGWEFDKVMISNHHGYQVAGHPRGGQPPCKFHNHWVIRTPPGWSCLFVPPLNRPNPSFEVIAGVVDTDSYQSAIHFPFFATREDGVHVIERGTPLVQVIPFKRGTTMINAAIRAESKSEAATRTRILRNTQAGEGWYRKLARARR
jgi:Family of unknown function (DUF6065)